VARVFFWVLVNWENSVQEGLAAAILLGAVLGAAWIMFSGGGWQ
jgi:hypothetical protein